MSLINQVLQDIDKRAVGAASLAMDSSLAGYDYLVSTSPRKQGQTRRRSRMRLSPGGFIVLALVAMVSAAWFARPTTSTVSATATTTADNSARVTGIQGAGPETTVIETAKMENRVEKPAINDDIPMVKVVEPDQRKLAAVVAKPTRSRSSPAGTVVRKRVIGTESMSTDQLVQHLEKNRGDLRARLELVKRYRAQNQAGRAEQVMLAGLQIDPGSSSLLYQLGHLYVSAEKFDSAIVVLERGINSSWSDTSTDVAYMSLLAQAYFQSRRYGSALPLFERVVSLSPLSESAWISLGLTYQAIGRYPQARNAYQKVLPLLEARRDDKARRLKSFVEKQISSLGLPG
ncbi:MAG: tetratricopeptide repeat protein [Gammaproteobacteria bacterium]|nr:tetratricopeptide repeat protein [Gammaproteobacteria bacterium]